MPEYIHNKESFKILILKLLRLFFVVFFCLIVLILQKKKKGSLTHKLYLAFIAGGKVQDNIFSAQLTGIECS